MRKRVGRPSRQRRVIATSQMFEGQLEDLTSALLEAEGALRYQRERVERVEWELGVIERPLLRALKAQGSDVADRRDLRLRLGLPA